MSSKAGRNNPRVWIRVKLFTDTGVIETNVKKRHLLEDRIPRDEQDKMIVLDQSGNTIHFNSWEYEGLIRSVPKKRNKYGGYYG